MMKINALKVRYIYEARYTDQPNLAFTSAHTKAQIQLHVCGKNKRLKFYSSAR
jgi:hypothetical protein